MLNHIIGITKWHRIAEVEIGPRFDHCQMHIRIPWVGDDVLHFGHRKIALGVFNFGGFANFTTGVVQDGDEMTVSTFMSSTLVSTFGFSVLLALPGLIPWLLITETIGLGDKAFTAGGLQIYILVLAASVYAGLQVWSKHYRKRTATMRAEIDRMLSQLQTTESR